MKMDHSFVGSYFLTAKQLCGCLAVSLTADTHGSQLWPFKCSIWSLAQEVPFVVAWPEEVLHSSCPCTSILKRVSSKGQQHISSFFEHFSTDWVLRFMLVNYL